MMWHGRCYKLRVEDNFPIATLKDEDGLDDPRELEKFRFARNGDHLLSPFQCDLCHFRNIQGRDPSPSLPLDKQLLIAIRRANMDMFWGRSEHTVKGNKGDVKQLLRFAESELGIHNLLPNMGPHPVEDEWGVGIACCILRKTLQPGLYGPNVQFETARKLRSAYSNIWGASIHTMTMGIMARDTAKTFLTKCPTYCLWFERFMRGMHARMGDDRRPDTAISLKVMHALMNRVEEDFLESSDAGSKRYLARCGLFFTSAYLGSLRGEEVPRVVRKFFYDLNLESLQSDIKHCVLPLYGRFKNERGVPRCFIFRIVCESKSGINMERWVRRVMQTEQNSLTKYLFANHNGRKESGGVYEPYLFAKLKAIQREETGLIPSSLDIEESYGIGRSFRRGSVTAAENAPNDECNDTDIKRNNRWRLEDQAGTRKASLDMLQLYTDTLHSVEADLKFSKCL